MRPQQILRMLQARYWLIVLLAVIGAVAGLIAARQIPKRYEARSRVVVDLLRADPVTGQALPPKTMEAFLAAQVELIRDPRVTRRVADQFGWTQSPELRAKHAAAQAAGSRAGLRDWLAEQASASTSAELIRGSPILEIAYVSAVPETARRGADAVREAFLAEALDSKRRDAAQNAGWFAGQAASLKARLAAAEERKAAFERANNIVLEDDNIDAESSKLRALASSAPAAVAAIATGPVVAPSAGQLAQVDAQLAAARQTLGVNHPEMVALQRQRGALAAAVAREMGSMRGGSESSGNRQAAEFGAQTQKVLAQRGLVDAARRLAGDVVVLREQVAKTMQRAADFELQAQSTDAGFSRLGAAATPRSPINPPRWMLVLAGSIAGMILGAVLAIAAELFARRVRGAEDLQQIDGLPLIGMLDLPRPTATAGWRGLFARPQRAW